MIKARVRTFMRKAASSSGDNQCQDAMHRMEAQPGIEVPLPANSRPWRVPLMVNGYRYVEGVVTLDQVSRMCGAPTPLSIRFTWSAPSNYARRVARGREIARSCSARGASAPAHPLAPPLAPHKRLTPSGLVLTNQVVVDVRELLRLDRRRDVGIVENRERINLPPGQRGHEQFDGALDKCPPALVDVMCLP